LSINGSLSCVMTNLLRLYEVLNGDIHLGERRNKQYLCLAPRPSGEADACVVDEWNKTCTVLCWSLATSGAFFAVLTEVYA
jgi:hypothetical protein